MNGKDGIELHEIVMSKNNVKIMLIYSCCFQFIFVWKVFDTTWNILFIYNYNDML